MQQRVRGDVAETVKRCTNLTAGEGRARITLRTLADVPPPTTAGSDYRSMHLAKGEYSDGRQESERQREEKAAEG